MADGQADGCVRMQQQQAGSQAISNHGGAHPVPPAQAATAKKAVGAQEVDKLLQNQPVKRVSLQTK